MGTALGLAVAHSSISDVRRGPPGAEYRLRRPWQTLAVILSVYAIAMAATLVPARRAARVHGNPARVESKHGSQKIRIMAAWPRSLRQT